MTITSKGYTGSVNYADWAVLTSHLSAQYTVFGADALKVGPGPGDRGIAIQPGPAAGQGIYDLSDAVETLAGTPVASGDRWDLVALRRDWGAKKTIPVIIEGTANRGIPNRQRTIGMRDDHPLALVRFAAGQTTVQDVIDLRVWGGDGGLVAADPLVRDFLDRVGTRVLINGVEWARDLSGTGQPMWRIVGAGRLLSVLELTWDNLPPSGDPELNRAGVKVWGLPVQTIARVNFDDPGVPYRVEGYACGFWGSEGVNAGNRHDFDFVVGGTATYTWLPPADGFDFRNWRSWTTPPSRQVFTGKQEVIFRARRIYGQPYGAVRPSESTVIASIYSA
ncbi:MAG: hypothetical protein FJW64_10970 [Actinobacteria bacterium]|nr:hypothetical protein [Actinomycetota bacterium]